MEKPGPRGRAVGGVVVVGGEVDAAVVVEVGDLELDVVLESVEFERDRELVLEVERVSALGGYFWPASSSLGVGFAFGIVAKP